MHAARTGTGFGRVMSVTGVVLLALAGSAPAAWAERGVDGELRLTFPQAVSTLNAFLSGGTKDLLAAGMVVEPLAGFDTTGTIYPRLVTEIPTVENGGIPADLTSVTWKLIPGLLWSDGTPFTAADVVFTAEYCMHPEGGCAQLRQFQDVEAVEIVDERTVTVRFSRMAWPAMLVPKGRAALRR